MVRAVCVFTRLSSGCILTAPSQLPACPCLGRTYCWMAFRIPHMYWSTSRPSRRAVLLEKEREFSLGSSIQGQRGSPALPVTSEGLAPLLVTAGSTGGCPQPCVVGGGNRAPGWASSLTCTQDTSRCLAHNSAAGTTPGQSTVEDRQAGETKSNRATCQAPCCQGGQAEGRWWERLRAGGMKTGSLFAGPMKNRPDS